MSIILAISSTSYSMYYENLLKNQHSLLYAREREIDALKESLKQKDLETSVTVQFQMSEQAHNLLLGKFHFLTLCISPMGTSETL